MTRHATQKQPAPTPRQLMALIGVLALVLGLVGFAIPLLQGTSSGLTAQPGGTASSSPVSTASSSESETAPEPEPEPEPLEAVFTLLAGGDVLPHEPVHDSARNGSGYDFSPLLAGIDQWVRGADLALCHLEVPFAPDGQKISGYPMFAASPDVAKALTTQGWNGCSTASNHSVDRKFAGVAKTLDVLDEVGLGHVGTARTEQESEEPQRYTVTVNGVDTVVAHLSATYGTNGLPIPVAQPWSVQLIDTDQLIEQARAAREAGADLVLVSVHAGNEYQVKPTDEQVAVASALAESGEVDLMIGHHAHVPQPMTKLDGGPDNTGMWVAYGLGNMLSNQDTQCCVPLTNSGLLLTAEVTHIEGHGAKVTSMHWVGLTVDRLAGHRLHALSDLTKLENGTSHLSAQEIRARYERVKDAVGADIPEQTSPPEPGEATVVVVEREKN